MFSVSAARLADVTIGSNSNLINAVSIMKAILLCLLSFGLCNAAWADVQIEFKDVKGSTSTISSNGQKVRINGAQMSGYVLVDSASGEFFMVDPKRKEIIRVRPVEIALDEEDERLSISLMPRGTGDEIAGYGTGRFDLISNGIQCGRVNGTSELVQNRELQHMFEAMQGMHKMMRSLLAGMTGLLTECQRATSRLADLVDTAGFVMRIVDDQGKLLFEVLLVNTKATLAENYYDLPADMTVVDMNQKVEQALQKGQEIIQQVPDMDQMMQQNGSQVDEQTQHQMKQMMDQMQELQSQ
jgi:hypothetical protein